MLGIAKLMVPLLTTEAEADDAAKARLTLAAQNKIVLFKDLSTNRITGRADRLHCRGIEVKSQAEKECPSKIAVGPSAALKRRSPFNYMNGLLNS